MEIESIKQKVLEDVDPVMRKKKAKERRKQRLIGNSDLHAIF